jgi:cobalt-zinc-cadmium efflux system outer membrane protein
MPSCSISNLCQGALCLSLLAQSGCTPSPFDLDLPESRPLLHNLPRYEAPADPSRLASQEGAVVLVSGELSLREALAAALLHNPRLRATAWGPRIEEANRLQAGLLPNPEAGVEFENFAGSGELSEADALETTLVLSQLIELGGKRESRMRVAEEAWRVSALDYEIERLAVLTETADRFVRVLEIQRRVEIAERARDLAEESRRVIDRRVQAGDVSPIDEIKARLESESARIAAERLKRDLDAARRDLSAMWDQDEPAFTSLLGSLDDLGLAPSMSRLAAQVEAHPEVLRWAAEADRLRAVVELERAQSVPDVTAGLGVRYVNEIDDTALVAGLSVPLPLFDRNQAGILAARLRAAQALDEGRASRRELATRLNREYARLTAAYHEAQAITDVLLPASRDAYEATRRAYEEGKVPYLSVLDAQRTLFDTEAQQLEALAEYHTALVQVEGLIATPLDTVSSENPPPPPTPGDQP